MVGIAALTEGVAILTDVYRIHKVTRYILEASQHMTTARITEKLKLASGVVARAQAEVEKEADALIAREEQLKHKSKSAFAPHHAHMQAMHKGLDDLEAQLALLSNEQPQGEPSTPLSGNGGR